MDKLEELNSADEEQAFLLLEPLIERAPEIARRVARRRPFESADDLWLAMQSELLDLNEEGRVRLFRAHPELAPMNPPSMTSASQSEQGRLNLTSDTNEFRARLDELNARYLDRFGFPFITALVRHEDMESVLSEFETRISADHESEIEQALEQVVAVSWSRVKAVFEDNGSNKTQDAVADIKTSTPPSRQTGSMETKDKNPDNPETPEAEEDRSLGWGGEIGGAILLVLSIIFMVGGWQLGLGVPTRLGTGAFPFISGALLAILSIVICIEERRGDGIAETPDWIAFMAICAALAVFAVTAERIGLVPAAFLTVIVASLPDRSLPFRGKAILGCIVALACWGLFIELLNLPFKPFVGL
jgi:OHCU decarboxylase